MPANQSVVEVGSFMGLSLAYLYFGTLEGNLSTVFSVDLDDPEYKKAKGVHPGLHRSDVLERACPYNDIVYYDGYSVECASKYARHWPQKQIGLLYIDASHEYEHVLQDFEAWAPLCAQGATVVFDDFNPDHQGVIFAVADLVADRRLEIQGLFSQGVITCLT